MSLTILISLTNAKEKYRHCLSEAPVYLVEKTSETWVSPGGGCGEPRECLMVRNLGTITLKDYLKGCWLMWLVNYWEIPGKEKSYILNKHLSACTIWLVYCPKVPLATLFWQHLCKTEAAVSDKGFIYLPLLSVDFLKGSVTNSSRVKQCLVRPRVPTSPLETFWASEGEHQGIFLWYSCVKWGSKRGSNVFKATL